MDNNEYLFSSTDRLVKIYDDLVQYALDDIVGRITKEGVITATAEYRIWKLMQLGEHIDKIKAYIKKMTKYTDKEIDLIFKNAGGVYYKPITQIFINNMSKDTIRLETSKYVKDIFSYYVKVTKGTVRNLTGTTLISSQNLLIDQLDKVHFRVVSGVQSYSQAISEAINHIGNSSLKARYPSGHKDSIDVAVRRAVVTGVNKCFSDINLMRAKENGYNHVLVSSHLGARHIENPDPPYLSHDIWQGKVYKVDWGEIPIVSYGL